MYILTVVPLSMFYSVAIVPSQLEIKQMQRLSDMIMTALNETRVMWLTLLIYLYRYHGKHCDIK